MIGSLLGTKLAMTHTYDPNGRWVAVTRLAMGPCVVTQEKTAEKDGYSAVQVVYGAKRRLTKPMAGHLAKGKLQLMPRFIREIRGDSAGVHVGDTLKVSDVFQSGDVVSVTGWSKGRGFSGVVKRWGFAGGPKTHGQSDRQRAPGSIGQGTTPGRVYKGKKMAGKHGRKRTLVKNLQVVNVDAATNQLWVAGAVPGYRNSPVIVALQSRLASDSKNDKEAS